MAQRIPRDESLSRVHGVGALFSAAYGNVGSSIYYALGVTAAFALGLTPVAFVISGLIFAATAATYAEGTVMYPEAGGSSSFARHAFNEFVSFFAAWGQMLNYIITVAISAFFVPHYLAVFWEPLGETPGDIIGGLVLIALLALLNVKGTQESARLNLMLAIGDLLTQLALVVAGLFLVLSPDTLIDNVDLGVAPTWGNFALGVAVGMIAFTGIETISNMAEETRDAARTVIRGYNATVAALIGVSRLTFSMGQYRQLPERLRQVHPRFETPYIAILVFSGVAMLTILPGQIDFLATMYSFGAMLSFTIAHVAVARLRQTQADRKRPWVAPVNL